MVKNLHKIIAILPLLLLVQVAQAINLGSVQKNNFIEIVPEETAEFIILIWNSENSSYHISFEVEKAPENWVVIINPRELELSNSPKGETETLNLPNRESIKAALVKVFVKTDEKTDEGDYEIVIRAVAGDKRKGISLMQERMFEFTVSVENPLSFFESTSETISKIGQDIVGGITGMIPSTFDVKIWFIIIASILILLVIWRFYKHV